MLAIGRFAAFMLLCALVQSVPWRSGLSSSMLPCHQESNGTEHAACHMLVHHVAEEPSSFVHFFPKAWRYIYRMAEVAQRAMEEEEDKIAAALIGAIKACGAMQIDWHGPEAISDARTYIATQVIEAKKFKGEKAKDITTKEELNKLTERINASSAVASKFKRDTEVRKRNASIQETMQLVDSVEGEVAKTTDAAAPLLGDESLTPDAAKEVCKTLATLEKAAQQRIEQAKTVLEKRARDMKGHAREEEMVAGLQKRLVAIQADLSKAKRAASEHEQRFVGKLLLKQATDNISYAEVQKILVVVLLILVVVLLGWYVHGRLVEDVGCKIVAAEGRLGDTIRHEFLQLSLVPESEPERFDMRTLSDLEVMYDFDKGRETGGASSSSMSSPGASSSVRIPQRAGGVLGGA